MLNNFGKTSELMIKIEAVDELTFIKDSFFTAPYKIAKPFYDYERNMLKIMVMAASAGIMEGDCYRMNINLQSGARAALMGQSYSKLHKMKDGYAVQDNHFILGEGSFFDYAQKPTIPFADSSFKASTECHMKKGSSFLYSEVLACGREKRGECFQFRYYKNCTKVYYEDELIFMDNQFLEPKSQQLWDIGFFEGFTHQATLGYFSEAVGDDLLEEMDGLLRDRGGVEYGMTRAKNYGIVIKLLGRNSDSLEKLLQSIRDLIYGFKHN